MIFIILSFLAWSDISKGLCEMVHVQTRNLQLHKHRKAFSWQSLNHLVLRGVTTYYIAPYSQKSPQLPCPARGSRLTNGGAAYRNDAVAINIFMGGLLCKAEGKYHSFRINTFNKKSARRGGFC